MKDKQRSIGFTFAWNGLKEVVKTERNFQLHLVATVPVIFLGFLLKINGVEWSIILLVIGLVLVTEMINTVVERMIDYIKPDVHPHAGMIKDMAAGAVLVVAFIAVIVGCIIYLPKVFNMMS